MPPTNLPLRWESTGDQWWFASPIDIAAANGHYEVVKHLLQIDGDLLIKLTSLPRIRRLESVWDDDDEHNFSDVAKNRSEIARKLLNQCETPNGHNSLIRAGYGGWLLYTAASAGDLSFVKELLDRDRNLVFGEGEFRVTDVLYAAARGKSREVFRAVFDCCVGGSGRETEVFRWEMVNRAVHAAARGGNLGVLREILAEGGGGDVLGYRDAQGCTLLHSAAARGQVEVVKDLISSYDIITSSDNQGNTALNVAAYRGHLPVVEVLVSASPSSASLTNKYGDTFLHMAVAGFRTPGFRRLDRQIELMKKLLGGTLIINVEDIINVRNNEGRTALHAAVIDDIQSEMVELLMSVRYIDLNVRDNDGNTPLDLLKQRPRSASSEILIRRMISAGGISHEDQTALNAQRSMHGIGGSPGTSFRIPDAELFSYAGIDDTYQSSCDFTSTEYNYSGEIEGDRSTGESKPYKFKRLGSMDRATRLLKNLLRWPGKNKRNTNSFDFEDNFSIKSSKICSGSRNGRVPLRQQFSKLSSIPSPSTKKKYAAGLTRGVLQVLPKSGLGSPSSAFSESSWSSPVSSDKRNGENRYTGLEKMKRKHASFDSRLMNSYFCFGAQGLAVENSVISPGQCGNQQSLVV
ncbi:hypothetical protein BUALT_Bualt05G0167300 [Buddleja alternifolia]|uniref:Ankyrin repeat-containing protein n=1 Tax=Buddleja alternifolia TaxID=168488 RepID=A0AAV6XT23_9LAMI|nr:hypothetical protein BUALT_Bualt05G0167300 [Buddleja alternifolia]